MIFLQILEKESLADTQGGKVDFKVSRPVADLPFDCALTVDDSDASEYNHMLDEQPQQ
jgi:hypothetical protein